MKLHRTLALSTALIIAAGYAPAAAQEPAVEEAPPLYDEGADASRQIAAALERATKENKRILIQWGANWCTWCKVLDGMMGTDRDVAREMLYEYEKVLIDVGQFDKHLDVAQKYGAQWQSEGVPYLTILGADGRVITNQGTVIFENTLTAADGHEPALVLRWLKKFEVRPLMAEEVLAAGLAEAAKTDRLVFLHSGAPWCGWCKRLERWMERPDITPIFFKDFVDVKIDVDRMTGGKELMDHHNGGYGGVPWLAILKPDGSVVITSVDPDHGNIGSPQAEWEVAYWNVMMRASVKRITEAEILYMAATWAEDRPR